MKFKKGDKVIELLHPHTFSIAEREGFKPVEEDPELAELVKRAQELGIKSAHLMKKETLLERIADAEKDKK